MTHAPARPSGAAAGLGETFPGLVYLLHLERPFGHARHYTGWARDLDGRLRHHERGTGANLLRHVRAAGIAWVLAAVEPGDRNRERRLKNQGGARRRCPICTQERVTK